MRTILDFSESNRWSIVKFKSNQMAKVFEVFHCFLAFDAWKKKGSPIKSICSCSFTDKLRCTEILYEILFQVPIHLLLHSFIQSLLISSLFISSLDFSLTHLEKQCIWRMIETTAIDNFKCLTRSNQRWHVRPLMRRCDLAQTILWSDSHSAAFLYSRRFVVQQPLLLQFKKIKFKLVLLKEDFQRAKTQYNNKQKRISWRKIN